MDFGIDIAKGTVINLIQEIMGLNDEKESN
jgi:hypothetical protein